MTSITVTDDSFMNYVTFDSNGFINGIRDDAPEAAKKSFHKYMSDYDDAELDIGIPKHL